MRYAFFTSSYGRDPVLSAPGPHVITADTRRISAAFGQVYHPQRNGHPCTQKRIKFKSVLESTEETCQYLDPGHVSTAATRVDSPLRERVGPTHNCPMRYVDSRESTAQKNDRLEREHDSAKQELESKTIDLQKKIQIPETEIAVERVKLDYETSRGRLREAENQRLQAEIAENSYHLPQTKPKRLSDGKSDSAVTHSVQRDRHFDHGGSPL
jgi:hypothetical protein